MSYFRKIVKRVIGKENIIPQNKRTASTGSFTTPNKKCSSQHALLPPFQPAKKHCSAFRKQRQTPVLSKKTFSALKSPIADEQRPLFTESKKTSSVSKELKRNFSNLSNLHQRSPSSS